MLLLAWVELTRPLRFHFSSGACFSAVAQGVLATFGAYLFWNWGLTHMPAARAGAFLNLEPVVGTILWISILHERLAALAMLGGVLIIGAAVYFSFHPHETEGRQGRDVQAQHAREKSLRDPHFCSGFFVGWPTSPGKILRPDLLHVEFCCAVTHGLEHFFQWRRFAFNPT